MNITIRNKLIALLIFIPVLFLCITGCSAESYDYNLRTAIMYNNGDGDIDFESKIYNGITAYEFAEDYGSQERADYIKKISEKK